MGIVKLEEKIEVKNDLSELADKMGKSLEDELKDLADSSVDDLVKELHKY